MREDPVEIAAQYRSFHFHHMDKGESVRDPDKRTADQMNVEPHAGEPCRQIRKQRTAQSADLLDGKKTAAEKAERNKEEGSWQKKQNGGQNMDRPRESETEGSEITEQCLCQSDWQDGLCVAEYKIDRRHGGGVEPLQKCTFPVTCDQCGGEQCHKRQSEHGDSRCEGGQRKQFYGNIGLDRGEQQDENDRKPKSERKIERITQNFPGGTQCIGINPFSHISVPPFCP